MSQDLKLDVSRDYMDGIMLLQPPPTEKQGEVKANAGLHFLPSSPDSTMHTAIASFSLATDDPQKPFARGGWRFLFTSSAAFDPKEHSEHPFLRNMLIIGTSKILAVINTLCLHANLPLVPIDPRAMARAAQPAPPSDGNQQAS